MFAIAEIKGFQFLLKEREKVVVPKIDSEVGETIQLNKVLFLKTQDRVWVGNPEVTGATIEAKVLAHYKGDKVTIYKFIRRENYRRKKGFRPLLSEIEIIKINPPT